MESWSSVSFLCLGSAYLELKIMGINDIRTEYIQTCFFDIMNRIQKKPVLDDTDNLEMT